MRIVGQAPSARRQGERLPYRDGARNQLLKQFSASGSLNDQSAPEEPEPSRFEAIKHK